MAPKYYYSIPIRDRETFCICGMNRDDYDAMASRDDPGCPITSEEFYIGVFKSALKRYDDQYLHDFACEVDMESFLYNLFQSKQPASNYLKPSKVKK